MPYIAATEIKHDGVTTLSGTTITPKDFPKDVVEVLMGNGAIIKQSDTTIGSKEEE